MPSPHEAGLAGCFPRVSGQTQFVQDGWDSLVVLIEERWIARIPRTARTARLAVTEVALFEVLAKRLPVAVPEPVATCREHGSMLYHRIPGGPLTRVANETQAHRLGTSLAAALDTLHRTPLDQAKATGVLDLSSTRWGDAYRTRCEQFRARVVPLLPESDRTAGQRLLDRLVLCASDPLIANTLVHRDLGPEHVLCSDGLLTGVIDWTDACIGDPAIDLAWALHGSPPHVAQTLEDALQVDAEVSERSLLYHQLGPWFEVEYGLDQGRDQLVSSGLRGVLDRLAPR